MVETTSYQLFIALKYDFLLMGSVLPIIGVYSFLMLVSFEESNVSLLNIYLLQGFTPNTM